MSAVIENGVLVKYDTEPGETAYHIPDTVTEIGPQAFHGEFGKPSYLQEVTIPGSVTKIGDFALSGLRECKGELIVPDSVTELGRGVFNGSSFRKIVIGRGVRILPPFMCDGNMFLAEIVIPDGVEEIAPMAFYACVSLKRVAIPSSVKALGADAFYHCTSLECVELPAHLEESRAAAFTDCPLLN